MKKTIRPIILSALFIFPIHILAQKVNLQILDSLTNDPIENVYVYSNENEFLSVSDKHGMCEIISPNGKFTEHISAVYISHIGYVDKVIKLAPTVATNQIKVSLKPTVFELREVTVATPPNANFIVQKAIENIPKNYPTLRADTLACDLNFVFLDNPTSKIADFKGKVAITSNGKYLLATKYDVESNFIKNTFYDYGNEISPSGFYSIIFIQSHAPIRQSKKMKFHYDGIVSQQGYETYKISFNRKSKFSNIKGYMLVNTNDYAITYITYEIGEIKKWIAATQKSNGIVYTNLENYKVSGLYLKAGNGYRFSEGTMNILFNRSKKENILSNNSYNVSVKTTKMPSRPNSLIFKKATELFRIK